MTAEAIMRHVNFLADPRLAGRLAGSSGEAQAANYVAEVLRQSGLLPHRQNVALLNGTSVNVYALVEAEPAQASSKTDELVVIGAHIDHLGYHYPGAEDNASGVAVVLELARALAQRRRELHRSILFLSLSYLSLTGRFGILLGQGTHAAFGEVGLLIKIPLAARWKSAPP